MMGTDGWRFFFLLAAVASAVASVSAHAEPAPGAESAAVALEKGNWADAYELLRKRLLDESAEASPDDLGQAVDCLSRLNRVAEFDAFVESVVQANGDRWRSLPRRLGSTRRSSTAATRSLASSSAAASVARRTT